MKKLLFILVILVSCGQKITNPQSKNSYTILTVAFYNVENLFDTEDDPNTFDDDRTPEGKDHWDDAKYQDKILKIAKVLSEIGSEQSAGPPAVIGLCEIENISVLEDLVNSDLLKAYKYEIIHYDSPDERGIDVALLYRRSFFDAIDTQSRRLLIYDKDNPDKRDYTRDQLVVSGLLANEKFHFIVNHWPSRSGGEAKSSYKREKAAALNKRIIDSIFKQEPSAKIISMGDYNDDPSDKSFKEVLNTKNYKADLNFQELYNPMEEMHKRGIGTLAYRDKWNLFDQLIVTQSLVSKEDSGFQFYKAGIFNKSYLITQKGQFKGYPFRSYGYGGYEGGYSDHFPVYIHLIRMNQVKNE